MNQPLGQSPPWRQLQALAQSSADRALPDLFRADARRCERFSHEVAGLWVDSSRQRVDAPIREALQALARERRLEEAIAALSRGDLVNNTEGRAARHMDLRCLSGDHDRTGIEAVDSALARMQALCTAVTEGTLTGFDARAMRSIVNLGIGGSDLGPRLVCDALPGSPAAPQARFAANLDGHDLDEALAGLDPATTLFIVTSKSFGTEETLANMARARAWLSAAGCPGQHLPRHFVAVTANPERARAETGLGEDRILPFGEWVGGRFSLWSAAGLAIALTRGWQSFTALLRGAAAMDRHYRETTIEHNLPAWLALLDVWNVNFLGAGSIAVLPYAHRLRRLPDYLQQLAMESNGKRVTRDGQPAPCATGPVFWGSAGTIGQHSFHQLLHQGTDLIPAEFILPLKDPAPGHQGLVAHCLSQALAMMSGEHGAALQARLREDGLSDTDIERLQPHLEVPGSRPCTLITLPQLDAWHLGALLALYEHRVHAASVIWGINAFDQWGVELGKRISRRLRPLLEYPAAADDDLDPATREAIARYHRAQSNHHPDQDTPE